MVILLLFTAIFGRDIPFNANIGIVNYDNSPLGIPANIISGLNSTRFLTVKRFDNETEALKELNATNVRAVMTIPADFTQNLFSGKANVSLVLDQTNPDRHD